MPIIPVEHRKTQSRKSVALDTAEVTRTSASVQLKGKSFSEQQAALAPGAQGLGVRRNAPEMVQMKGDGAAPAVAGPAGRPQAHHPDEARVPTIRELIQEDASAETTPGANGAGPTKATGELVNQVNAVVIGSADASLHNEELLALFNRGFSRSKKEEVQADLTLIAQLCTSYGADFEQVKVNWRKNRSRHDDPDLVRESLVAGLIKNKLDPESTVQNDVLDSPEMEASKSLSMLLTYAMNGKLKKWIGKDEARRAKAIEWFERLVPDVSELENNGGAKKEGGGPEKQGGLELGGVNAAVANFKDWDLFEYDVIIVPGFTPRAGLEPEMTQSMDPKRKEEEGELARMSQTWGDDIRLHPTAIERLKLAVSDFASGKAPFVLLTGSNVWPKGTDIYEAVEMKKWLLQEGGVPADRIIVDAKAKHSTTNIRNAGRYMLDHGMKKGLVTTSAGQNFYFGHSILSSYAFRALGDMGVVPRLRGLGLISNHSVFKPGEKLERKSLTDPSDM